MDLDTVLLLILISSILICGGILFHCDVLQYRRRKQALKEAAASYERRRTCEVCTGNYDYWTSDAPELYREVFCSDSCYRTFTMMDQFERQESH